MGTSLGTNAVIVTSVHCNAGMGQDYEGVWFCKIIIPTLGIQTSSSVDPDQTLHNAVPDYYLTFLESSDNFIKLETPTYISNLIKSIGPGSHFRYLNDICYCKRLNAYTCIYGYDKVYKWTQELKHSDPNQAPGTKRKDQQIQLTHCILNRLSHTIFWAGPRSLVDKRVDS